MKTQLNNMPIRALLICIIFVLILVMNIFPRTIEFAGITWNVKTGHYGPGPNDWSDSEESVWVDDNGYLHLKIRNENDTWYCAEIYTPGYTTYGKHTFIVQGPVDSLDKNVVLGLFLYADDVNEVDIEFSRWGDWNTSNNAYYTVQPHTIQGNSYGFGMTLDSDISTHSFNWQSEYVLFKSTQGTSTEPRDIIENHIYWGESVPPVSRNLRTHINFWLNQGSAPETFDKLEVIIRDLIFPSEQEIGDKEQDNLAGKFSLGQNFPNPFNNSTIIPFHLASRVKVTINIFSVEGELRESISNGYMDAGPHQYHWSRTEKISSGIYYYTVVAGKNIIDVQKMVLLK